VAADLDAVPLHQAQHLVGDAVVLVVLRPLRAVPLHLVLEGGHGEARGEPLLVRGELGDLLGGRVAERETHAEELDAHVGVRDRLAVGGAHGDHHLHGSPTGLGGGAPGVGVPLVEGEGLQ